MPSFGSTGRKKRVKAGGDIVSYGSDHFFALKGNKTLEFWRYGLRPPVGRTSVVPAGVQAGAAGEGGRLRVVTNPLTSGRVSLDYSLPEPGPVTLRLYDMAGRRVLARAVAAGRAGRARLDLGQLAAGVYLARLDAGAVRGSAKLIVE
jgi:hypothetical protein